MHVVTDDDVLSRLDHSYIEALFERGAANLAFHLRGPMTAARRIAELAERLAQPAHDRGVTFIINDRVDVALAVGANGVHLGRRSAPPFRVRSLLGWHRLVGTSVHDREEANAAVEGGTDYVFMGTIYPSATHVGRAAVGVNGLNVIAQAVAVPVVAIGGITPERVAEVRTNGGYGIAVIRGVWNARDPVAALGRYIEELHC